MQTRRKFFTRMLQGVGALAVVPFLPAAQASEPEVAPWIKMPEFDGRVEYLSWKLARSFYNGSVINQNSVILQIRQKDTAARRWGSHTVSGKPYGEYAIEVQDFKGHEASKAKRLLWSIVGRHLEEERKHGHLVHRVPPEVHAFEYDPNLDKFEHRKLPKRWIARAYLRYAVT